MKKLPALTKHAEQSFFWSHIVYRFIWIYSPAMTYPPIEIGLAGFNFYRLFEIEPITIKSILLFGEYWWNLDRFVYLIDSSSNDPVESTNTASVQRENITNIGAIQRRVLTYRVYILVWLIWINFINDMNYGRTPNSFMHKKYFSWGNQSIRNFLCFFLLQI